MDLDGDGWLDVISGSYPGELYLFPGREGWTFRASQKIQDKRGQALSLGQASSVHAADWDRDGDLDLVVGDIRGHVWWLPNGSGGKDLVFDEAVRLAAEGEATIRVPHGDAGPVLADWDGDGTLDLVVGCGDGSVRFYANRNAEGGPDLAAFTILIEAPEGGMCLQPGEDLRPGARAKPCVVDWNGDGRLDLLVGDVTVERPELTGLNDEETAQLARLERKIGWIQERYQPALRRVQLRVLESLGVEVTEGGFAETWPSLSSEQQARYRDAFEEAMGRDVEAQALFRMMMAANQQMSELRPRIVIHGRVWAWIREGATG